MPAKYVQQDVRAGNKSLIFTLLFPNGQYSRADISRMTGLSRVSASSVISQMIEAHMVREVGVMSRVGRGKRATSVSVDGDYWRIITLDISSAKTFSAALTTLKAEVLDHMSIENPEVKKAQVHGQAETHEEAETHGQAQTHEQTQTDTVQQGNGTVKRGNGTAQQGNNARKQSNDTAQQDNDKQQSSSEYASFEAISTLVSRLMQHNPNAHILGISVSCSGAIDHQGNVIRSTSLGWFHFPLSDLLSERFHCPVCVENDAHLALLAERYLGSGTQNFLLVRMHRGVGAAIMIDDELITGPSGAAGEIGHVVVQPSGKRCVCGKRGCLETVVSVPTMRKIITSNPTAREKVYQQAGDWLGMALALPVNLLELNDIVIDGPEDVISDEFLASVADALTKHVDSDFLSKPHLRRCELGENAVLKGAAIKLVRTIVEQKTEESQQQEK